MPISDVAICNHALDLLGADPIVSLDDDTQVGRLCKRNYEPVRDAVLRAYPWNPAIRRAALPALADAPAWGFLPVSPCPRGRSRRPAFACCDRKRNRRARADYRIEGGRCSAMRAAASILYIAQITDPTRFGPLLADAIAARLAAELAYR